MLIQGQLKLLLDTQGIPISDGTTFTDGEKAMMLGWVEGEAFVVEVSDEISLAADLQLLPPHKGLALVFHEVSTLTDWCRTKITHQPNPFRQ